MKRRDFITLFGSAALAAPRTARAQQTAMPTIAYVSSRSEWSDVQLVAAFRAGLNSQGFREGRDVVIELKWAQGQYDRLPAMMADVVSRSAAVIVAPGSPAGLAAKTATSTIPILFNTGSDPVGMGLVRSLSRPGGNMTGVLTLVGDLSEKNFGLLHDLLPRARRIAVLTNPDSAPVSRHLAELEAAAHSTNVQLVPIQARTLAEIETAFADMARRQVEALLVVADPFLFTSAREIVARAAEQSLPAMYFRREFADAGGLMSYGSVTSESYRQLGIYAGRILKGEKPADLPVVQPTKFELVINMKAAKALGINIPNSMQLLADEIIE